jgi:hypothetical protein
VTHPSGCRRRALRVLTAAVRHCEKALRKKTQ